MTNYSNSKHKTGLRSDEIRGRCNLGGEIKFKTMMLR